MAIHSFKSQILRSKRLIQNQEGLWSMLIVHKQGSNSSILWFQRTQLFMELCSMHPMKVRFTLKTQHLWTILGFLGRWECWIQMDLLFSIDLKGKLTLLEMWLESIFLKVQMRIYSSILTLLITPSWAGLTFFKKWDSVWTYVSLVRNTLHFIMIRLNILIQRTSIKHSLNPT